MSILSSLESKIPAFPDMEVRGVRKSWEMERSRFARSCSFFAKRAAAAFSPVSYTHLDVYKRQEQGWTFSTAVSMLIFSVLHWPCATTLLTIKKETHSLKWTALAFLLPTCMGFLLCFLVTCFFRILSLS